LEVFSIPTELPKSKINSILLEIKQKGDLSGVILSYRDGGLIAENYGKEFDTNTFTAMCASIIGGAEGLGQTIGDRSFRKIVTELDDKSIIMIGCGTKSILTLILERTSTGGSIFENLDNLIKEISKLF
jgi:predicted regulator of Ras-like GTPase activity (Roadblock/LC7/MglB family)